MSISTPADWVAIGLSTLAFGLSVVGFVRTSRVEDRQYVSEYTAELRELSFKMLDTFEIILADDLNDINKHDRKKILSDVLIRVDILRDRFLILAPGHRKLINQKNESDESPKYVTYRPTLHLVIDGYIQSLKGERDSVRWHIDDPCVIDQSIYVPIKERFVREIGDMSATHKRFYFVSQKLGNPQPPWTPA